MHKKGRDAQRERGVVLDSSALAPELVACVNGLLASAQKDGPDTGFSNDEIVELLESLMPERGQVLEPVWSPRQGRWQWLPVA